MGDHVNRTRLAQRRLGHPQAGRGFPEEVNCDE
jgi:hypothetical protein